MIFNIHAGHNPDGKVACGAVGLIHESTQAREVVAELSTILRSAGHTVYDCTCNNGTGQTDVLKKIVNTCNQHDCDLNISIHFNAGANDRNGNGATTGVEVLTYNNSGTAYTFAKKIASCISELGFKNRGIKARSDLYVLSHTKSQAILIECCFVDDADDVNHYKPSTMAQAIAKGLGVETLNDRYNTLTEVPEWARKPVAKLIENGKFADTRKLDLSYDMIRLIVLLSE